MATETDPKTKPVPVDEPEPGGVQPPTFDELPPPGYEAARKREIKELCKEHNMTPQDVERYEKMAEEESQEEPGK